MTTSLMKETRRDPFAVESRELDVTSPRGEWVMQATCRNVDPDLLFVRGAEQRQAATICDGCPVLMQCRADALDNRVEFGVWGGLTERQRRAILRKNPNVDNWAEFFARGGAPVGL
ncbi:WhiB family transcriptional regulator [Corynebacterium gerontici]|uniref:Transcriptional regulator WhiB n=1 Tax=Corynebacterium gerontici TaxID=2079234 RepID=A0A3G6J8E2_9CORY|nr:WhiB family transcriptional regulator [Corynebacterium gerontici]AZA12294.1 Transcriptional regulator WhiB4 [Corynebacterium gerontici]